MWTARYGVLGSEEEITRTDIISPKKDHLELEIHMNEIGHEDENDNKIDKRNQYKPYFTKRNHERSASSPKRHKIVTVHGDGRMSQKEVIRYANAQSTKYVHKYYSSYLMHLLQMHIYISDGHQIRSIALICIPENQQKPEIPIQS